MALNLLHDLRIDQGTGRTCNKLLSLFSYTESVLAVIIIIILMILMKINAKDEN